MVAEHIIVKADVIIDSLVLRECDGTASPGAACGCSIRWSHLRRRSSLDVRPPVSLDTLLPSASGRYRVRGKDCVHLRSRPSAKHRWTLFCPS